MSKTTFGIFTKNHSVESKWLLYVSDNQQQFMEAKGDWMFN